MMRSDTSRELFIEVCAKATVGYISWKPNMTIGHCEATLGAKVASVLMHLPFIIDETCTSEEIDKVAGEIYYAWDRDIRSAQIIRACMNKSVESFVTVLDELNKESINPMVLIDNINSVFQKHGLMLHIEINNIEITN